MVTDVYHFVVYEMRMLGAKQAPVQNIIVKDMHPVVWASLAHKNISDQYITVLHFFKEIPEEAALEQAEHHWAKTVGVWHG